MQKSLSYQLKIVELFNGIAFLEPNWIEGFLKVHELKLSPSNFWLFCVRLTYTSQAIEFCQIVQSTDDYVWTGINFPRWLVTMTKSYAQSSRWVDSTLEHREIQIIAISQKDFVKQHLLVEEKHKNHFGNRISNIWKRRSEINLHNVFNFNKITRSLKSFKQKHMHTVQACRHVLTFVCKNTIFCGQIKRIIEYSVKQRTKICKHIFWFQQLKVWLEPQTTNPHCHIYINVQPAKQSRHKHMRPKNHRVFVN